MADKGNDDWFFKCWTGFFDTGVRLIERLEMCYKLMVRTHVFMMDTYGSGPLNFEQRLRTIDFSAHGSSGTEAVMDRLFRLWEG